MVGKKEKISLKQWIKKTWDWLRRTLLNKEMIPFVLIAEAIFWIPVYVPFIIGLITGNKWWWSISTGAIVFWAGPFTPAIELQLGLAVIIKKLFKRKNKNENK